MSNTLMLDARSLEQHGDIYEEVMIQREILKVGEKLLKKHLEDYE